MAENDPQKIELLQIADAVAREKLIEPELVIEAMEESLAKAAKSKYGAEYDIRAKIDSKSGELSMNRCRLVVEEIENHFTEITIEEIKGLLPDAKIGDTSTY